MRRGGKTLACGKFRACDGTVLSKKLQMVFHEETRDQRDGKVALQVQP